jgi:anti-sigma B factor antagonist
VQLSWGRTGDVHVLRIGEGRLTYPLLSPFFAAVLDAVEQGARKVVLDLEAVGFVDSAALGCIIEIQTLLRQRGGAVKLARLQPRIDTMVTMAGLRRVLEVHRHTEDALAAFSAVAEN